jgi:outer membrane protein
MVSHTVSLSLRTIAIAALTLLSLATARAQMKGDFDAADANHDGRVSFEEFATYAKRQLDSANGAKAQRFKQLSSQQQTTLLRKRFDKVDHSHKGYLDRDDWGAPSASSSALGDPASDPAAVDAGSRQRTPKEWDVLAGLGAEARPTYQGSDRQFVSVGPYGYVTWNSTVTLGRNGLMAYWHRDGIKIGGGLTYSPGRRDASEHGFFSAGDDRLQGLGNIDRALGLKVFADYPLGPIIFDVSVVKFEGKQNDGVLATIGMSVAIVPTPKITIRPHLSAVWANNEYMETFFGVTPLQSSQSIFPVFIASRGVRDVSAGMSLEWRIDEHWLTGTQFAVRRYEGDAARSPLTFSRTNTVFGVAVGYHF